MKIAMPALALGLIAAGASSSAERKTASFDRAERLLAGKVAGKPLSCISLRGVEGNTSLASDRILFETRGALLYVNERGAPARPSIWGARLGRTADPACFAKAMW